MYIQRTENRDLTDEEDIQKAFRLAEYIKNGVFLSEMWNNSIDLFFHQKRLLFTLYANTDI
jgi:hypothetical protein